MPTTTDTSCKICNDGENASCPDCGRDVAIAHIHEDGDPRDLLGRHVHTGKVECDAATTPETDVDLVPIYVNARDIKAIVEFIDPEAIDLYEAQYISDWIHETAKKMSQPGRRRVTVEGPRTRQMRARARQLLQR